MWSFILGLVFLYTRFPFFTLSFLSALFYLFARYVHLLLSAAYLRYAFSALVRNQMVGSIYSCGSGCECMFVTSLVNQCKIDGSEAAAKLGYGTENWLSYVSPLGPVGFRYFFFVLGFLRRSLFLGAFGGYCGWDERSCLGCFILEKEVIFCN